MELLEREQQLTQLADLWRRARSGEGHIALIGGEAGIGKTSLINRFVAMHGRPARVWHGACDALFAPQPLGPFVDLAAQGLPDLGDLIQAGAGRLAFSSELLRHLQQSPLPVILVLEDLHWADEATLDVTKFLGRRIQHTRTLLILSYRDDEVSGNHPLRFLLGDLPAARTGRITLPPLSPGGVERLERQSEWRPEGLYHATGGNPFFVTEILSSREGIPPSVRDAVLVRCSRLSAPARAIVEMASLSPGAAEAWLIRDILQPDAAALDECLARGILRPVSQVAEGDSLAFRHELARQAVEDSLLIGRSRELHARILAALLQREAHIPLARLVHHAVRAGDEEALLRLAPRAARQAAAVGAHREAVALYDSLLPHRHRLTPAAQAEILDNLSVENYLIDRAAAAIQARQQALQIWQELERPEQVGEGYRWLSRFYWMAGNGEAAEKCADQAIAILQALPPGPPLAMAYSAKSQLHMLAWDEDPALEWGRRAIDLAEELGDVEILIHATTNVGSIETLRDYQAGTEKIVFALRLAREHKMHDHVGRCYSNLASNYIRSRQYAAGRRWLEEGLEYTTARDLDTYTIYLLGWQAQMEFETGHWAEAETVAREALRLVQSQTITTLPALVTLGHLKVRQGDAAAGALLDEAYALALTTRELQRHAPVAAARAEAAWLRGQPEQIPDVAGLGYGLALERNDFWILSELAYWMWRSGSVDVPLVPLLPPYSDMIRGEWATAAEGWRQLGCPYEQALALMAGDEPAQLQALALFESLGARPAAAIVRDSLRARGITDPGHHPRRPRGSHPDELTPREIEVLSLIAAGLSNPAIAERLTISVGTVKAHTAGIYSKLGVNNRVQALARARALSLLPGS